MRSCSFCQRDQQEVICIHSDCVKSKDNKFTCFKCFCEQHDGMKGHRPYKLSDIIQMAQEIRKKHIEFLEGIIIKNDKNIQETTTFFDDQKQNFIKWLDQQQKQVQIFFESYNKSLQEKIYEAQILQMDEKDNNLDTIIQYCLLNINQLQQQQSKNDEQFTDIRKLKVNDITNGINLIKDSSLSYSEFQFGVFEMAGVNLPTNENILNIQIQQCQHHQKKKNYICIHNECIENNSTCPFFCKQCYQDNHKQHDFQRWAKKYKIIMKEQKKKVRFMLDQQEKVKQKIQEEFNIIIMQIQQHQLEENKIYQQKMKEIFQLKEKQINNLNNLLQFKQNGQKIYINLLNQNNTTINQQFSHHKVQFINELSQIKEQIDYKHTQIANLQSQNEDLQRQLQQLSKICTQTNDQINPQIIDQKKINDNKNQPQNLNTQKDQSNQNNQKKQTKKELKV